MPEHKERCGCRSSYLPRAMAGVRRRWSGKEEAERINISLLSNSSFLLPVLPIAKTQLETWGKGPVEGVHRVQYQSVGWVERVDSDLTHSSIVSLLHWNVSFVTTAILFCSLLYLWPLINTCHRMGASQTPGKEVNIHSTGVSC